MFRKYLIDIERWWQRGAVLAFFAMGLPAFIAMTGLVLELGHLYFEQADLQNTVESVARATLKAEEPTWVPLSDEVYKSLQNDSNSIVPSNSGEKLSGRETLSTYNTNAEDYVQKINEELRKESKTLISCDDSVVTARISGNNTYLEFTLKKDFQNWFSGFFGIGEARTASTVAKIVPKYVNDPLNSNTTLNDLKEQLKAADVDTADKKLDTIDTVNNKTANGTTNYRTDESNVPKGIDNEKQPNQVYDRIITNETNLTSNSKTRWIWNDNERIYVQAINKDVTLVSVPTTGRRDGKKPVYIQIDDTFNHNFTLEITDYNSNNSNSNTVRKPIILVYNGENEIEINIKFSNELEEFLTLSCTIIAPNATVNITKTKENVGYKIEGWIVAKTITNTDNIPIEYKQVQ